MFLLYFKGVRGTEWVLDPLSHITKIFSQSDFRNSKFVYIQGTTI